MPWRVSRSRSAMPSSPTARDALTSIASPGRSRLAALVERRSASAIQCISARPARGRRAPARRRPTSTRSRARASERPDLARGSARDSSPSSAISPRIATRRLPRRALGEVDERGPHRDRVRVVGVVDDEAAAGQRELLAAPAARARSRAAPSCARSSGSPSASYAVSAASTFSARWRCAERAARARARSPPTCEAASAVASIADDASSRVEAADLEVVRAEVRLELGSSAGTTAMPPGGSASIASAFARGDVLDGADELEVLGADRRDDARRRAARSRRAPRSARARACPSR